MQFAGRPFSTLLVIRTHLIKTTMHITYASGRPIFKLEIKRRQGLSNIFVTKNIDIDNADDSRHRDTLTLHLEPLFLAPIRLQWKPYDSNEDPGSLHCLLLQYQSILGRPGVFRRAGRVTLGGKTTPRTHVSKLAKIPREIKTEIRRVFPQKKDDDRPRDLFFGIE